MKAIFSREVRSYFQTMLGPVFIAVLTAVTGIYFMVLNLVNGYPYFSATIGNMLFMLMVAVPILTMKSFAEDRHSHAEQLMLSAPVTVWDIVLGKYFAMAAVFAIPCLLFCLCPLIIMTGGTASLGSDWAAIGLYFLLGCAYIAIGMFLSSITESQLIAAVASFGVLLVLYLWDALAEYFPTSARGNLIGMIVIAALLAALYYALARNPYVAVGVFVILTVALIIAYLVSSTTFEGLMAKTLGTFDVYTGFVELSNYRLLDLTTVVRYLSLAFFGVFLTVQSLQKRRWA